MQVTSHWTAPSGPLGRLTGHAYERAAALGPRRAELAARAADAPPAPSMAAALARSDVAVIAEIKRRSPSKGAINPTLSAAAQARAYATGGAAALSVLTEPSEFGGSGEDLAAARAACPLPAIKKDFHVDEIQLLEARALGASAVLLIARALDPARLEALDGAARQLGLETLIEVRDDDELARAVALRPLMIGVNNRDLETLVIDASTGGRVIPGIPTWARAVFESGVASRADIERAAACGADAVLVGSALSGAVDPTEALRDLTGVPVQRGSRRAP